ncbi:MAG: methyl-accepting chemotaxis protein [Gemmatimonadota bacterium]
MDQRFSGSTSSAVLGLPKGGPREADPESVRRASPEHPETLPDLLRTEHERLSKGLGNVQANLADCVALNRESLVAFEGVQKQFEVLDSSSSSIARAAGELTGLVNGSLEKVNSMTRAIEAIDDLVATIVSIASQTNMLALNATIEAARAGDAGRGFAVVAGQVKALAQATREAAEQITQAAGTLKGHAGTVQTSMVRSNEKSETISREVTELSEALGETVQSSLNTTSRVFGTNDRIFMSLAKLDHVVWKVNTYNSLLQKKPTFPFVDHHNCRLGKWYDQGDGYESFRHTPSYAELQQPHSVVHDGTRRLFELIADGGSEDFAAAAAALGEMEEGSEAVFALLDRILQEKAAG